MTHQCKGPFVKSKDISSVRFLKNSLPINPSKDPENNIKPLKFSSISSIFQCGSSSSLISRNDLQPNQILSITFSVTTDLDACFPASIARKQKGWEAVALIDCQQMFVKGDLENCIRILAHAWLPDQKKPEHPYLGKASLLRPDR